MGAFLFLGIQFALDNPCGEHGVHQLVPMFGPPSTANSGGGSFFLGIGFA